jgi:hypothetical protein
MYTRRCIISFKRFKAEVLIELAWYIHSKMTGNSYFTTPDPTLAILKAVIEDFQAKLTMAMEGGKSARAVMKDARIVLNDTLHSLGLYVLKVANGNETIMISSGFPMSKIPDPAQRDNFWVIRGPNPGDILIGCVAWPKARAYVWLRFTGANPPDDKMLWTLTGVSTQAKMGLTNLNSGSREWLCYCAVTPAGMMAWSEAISIIVG